MNVIKLNAPDFWERASVCSPPAVFVSPTDTTYGLGVLAEDKVACDRLAQIKNRNPAEFILLVRNFGDVEARAVLSPRQRKTLERCWPDPITFVLQGRLAISVAVRMPRNGFIQRWMEFLGGPILSTSCNWPGKEPASNIEDAVRMFGPAVDLYIDGGVSQSISSTIVDLRGDPKVLRKGVISFPCRESEGRV